MNQILARIDPQGNTDAVIDWAAWAAVRLAAPLEFLHVLDRHSERAEASDLSGTIGIDAQASLLHELSAQDELRSRGQREAGRVLLAHARERAAAARAELEQARSTLERSGVSATAELAAGEPHQVLPRVVISATPALLVMGAFGHSRPRRWLLGSTTSTLLRVSGVPVLILR